MRKARPSRTAQKVALNIVTLWAQPEMDKVLPAGLVDATATLLVESGAVIRRPFDTHLAPAEEWESKLLRRVCCPRRWSFGAIKKYRGRPDPSTFGPLRVHRRQ
jgi:hypothetical protein